MQVVLVNRLWGLSLPKNSVVRLTDHPDMIITVYSLIQTKCQGGNKYALPITVKFDQSIRRFGRISFARLLKLIKHIALIFYLLSPYLLSCMRGLRNVRKIYIIKTILKFCVHWSTVCGKTNSDTGEIRTSVSQVCAALQRPIISKMSA